MAGKQALDSHALDMMTYEGSQDLKQKLLESTPMIIFIKKPGLVDRNQMHGQSIELSSANNHMKRATEQFSKTYEANITL